MPPYVIIKVDQQKAASLGIAQSTVTQAINTALNGEDVSFLHNAHVKYPIAIRMEFKIADKANLEALKSLHVRSINGTLVPFI